MRENVKSGQTPPKKKSGSVLVENKQSEIKPHIQHNVGNPKVIGAPQVKEAHVSIDKFSDQEIESKFEIVMTEMGMKDEKMRQNLRSQPKENKIRMIQMHEDKKKTESGHSPEQLIQGLKKDKVSAEFIKSCSQELKSASVNWIVEFTKRGGIGKKSKINNF